MTEEMEAVCLRAATVCLRRCRSDSILARRHTGMLAQVRVVGVHLVEVETQPFLALVQEAAPGGDLGWQIEECGFHCGAGGSAGMVCVCVCVSPSSVAHFVLLLLPLLLLLLLLIIIIFVSLLLSEPLLLAGGRAAGAAGCSTRTGLHACRGRCARRREEQESVGVLG